jgi:protein-S-isoprenylcysteine O-methyltransferase Ste14
MSAEGSKQTVEAGETGGASADIAANRKRAQTAVLALGPLRLTGVAAQITVFALVAGIVALVAHYRARILATPLTISALLWIAWNFYWGVAAKKTASTVRSESTKSRAFHQYLLLLAFFLLFAPLPWLDRRLLPPGEVWVVLGLVLQVGFFGLSISARRTLGRNWSGAITEKVDHELIRSGPYRFVRHPIYTAIIGMFLGAALVSGDVHAFLAVAVITGAYLRKIRLEEQNLAKVFGPRYDEYRRETRALIPWIL